MQSAPREQSAPLACNTHLRRTAITRKIGGAFTVGKAEWFGPVIASPEALYLLKVRRQNSVVPAAAAAGGWSGSSHEPAAAGSCGSQVCDRIHAVAREGGEGGPRGGGVAAGGVEGAKRRFLPV